MYIMHATCEMWALSAIKWNVLNAVCNAFSSMYFARLLLDAGVVAFILYIFIKLKQQMKHEYTLDTLWNFFLRTSKENWLKTNATQIYTTNKFNGIIVIQGKTIWRFPLYMWRPSSAE